MSGTRNNYLTEQSFVPASWPGFLVRDLGIVDATGGNYTAFVLQSSSGAKPVSDWTGGDETFFLGYVLQGSIEIEFESIGVQRVSRHGAVYSQNKEKRRILSCSGDSEFLNIASTTLAIDAPKGARVQHAEHGPYGKIEEGGAGQRDHMLYRNFGVDEATNGAIGVHMGKVTKAAETKGKEKELVRQWHKHVLDFHCLYVTSGSAEFKYGDVGTAKMDEGTMLFLPPLMPHAEVHREVGLEGIEITAPAKYATEIVDDMEAADQLA